MDKSHKIKTQGRRISGGPGCLERRHIFLLSWQAAMVLAQIGRAHV